MARTIERRDPGHQRREPHGRRFSDDRLRTIDEIASDLMVSKKTVMRWIYAGLLSCYFLPAGTGRRPILRVRWSEFDAFVRAHRLNADVPTSAADQADD